jgi:hypothetical protein
LARTGVVAHRLCGNRRRRVGVLTGALGHRPGGHSRRGYS